MSSAKGSREEESPLLEVRGLSVHHAQRGRKPPFVAVDGVDFDIQSHETLGLVGESGAGKSTIGRALLGLTPVQAGTIRFAGSDITHAKTAERRRLSADIQAVFQDPYSSLNPARTIGQSLLEVLRPHGGLTKVEATERMNMLLDRVGLPLASLGRYPAQFSGGQRQRIAIARALMVGPRLVVCDEAVSALDRSNQAQILNLLRDLQDQFGLSYLFISHNLAVVRHISNRIVVLYRGQVMEAGVTEVVCNAPVHPYTQGLHDSEPVPEPELQAERRLRRLATTVDSTLGIPERGCPFAPRCAHASDQCWAERPSLEVTPAGSTVACHHWRDIPAGRTMLEQAATLAEPTLVNPHNTVRLKRLSVQNIGGECT